MVNLWNSLKKLTNDFSQFNHSGFILISGDNEVEVQIGNHILYIIYVLDWYYKNVSFWKFKKHKDIIYNLCYNIVPMKKVTSFIYFLAIVVYSQTPITDTNFTSAINTCLSANPLDGNCTNSEFGAMPNWDVSKVTDMCSVFSGRIYFNADISNWDVSSGTIMKNIFYNVNPLGMTFNQDISYWVVSSVTNMNGMFNGLNSFN